MSKLVANPTIQAILANHRKKLISTQVANRQLKDLGHPGIKEEILPNLIGSIPKPIPKKILKKVSGNQPLTKEETFGFADASAPSNSNYQSELSPTVIAKSKNLGKKKMKKTVREHYNKKLVELANVCPSCNNTGVMRKFGNNMLCDSPGCTAGTDKRVDQENLMFKQAKDMLSKGMTTPVAEGTYRSDDPDYNEKREKEMKNTDKYYSELRKRQAAKRAAKAEKPVKNESVVSSLDDIIPVLEAYKASDKLLSRTKYLVQPKLSKTLRDRLEARKGQPKKSKGYTPSAGTLGLAAARKAQMSHSLKKKEKVEEEIDLKKIPRPPQHQGSTHEQLKDLHKLANHFGLYDAADLVKGHIERTNKKMTEGVTLKKKPNLSAHTPGKGLPALSAKPMMGSSNDNRVSEGSEIKKVTGGGTEGLKRKYLGKLRGRTATNRPAHAIEIDPVIKTNTEVNKVVK